MPRQPRREGANAIHHVVAQGNNRHPIVLDDRDRVALLRRLAATCGTGAWDGHAYCLMSTHLHAVLQTHQPNLGAGVGRLLGGYSNAFNRRHGREGAVFRRPLYSVELESDEHALAGVLYVVVNPVRAGLCSHPSEWPWSSYRSTLNPTRDFVATELVLGMLAEDDEAARARFRVLADERVERIAQERRRVGR